MKHEMPENHPAFGGKKFDYKKVIQWLGFVLRCPICGFKYDMDQTKIIETETKDILDEAHILIHSDCSKCKSSVMFNIEIKGPEIFSVGMITDLTHQDSRKFQKRDPISANEIIGIHENLKKFNGNFIEALTKK